MDIIIKRSSELPAFGEKIYRTHECYQTCVLNNIYEGENETLFENLFFGTLKISKLSPKPKGQVHILEVKATEVCNENNFSKLEIKEKEGIKQNELQNIKTQANNSKLINFSGYNNIKDKIIEKQEKLNLVQKESKDLYLDMINELISLEEKSETEKINEDIYISYIK